MCQWMRKVQSEDRQALREVVAHCPSTGKLATLLTTSPDIHPATLLSVLGLVSQLTREQGLLGTSGGRGN